MGTTTTQPGGGSDAFVTKVGTSGAALVYSTYIGGSAGSDYGYGIAVDGSGSAYITGYTGSSNFPVVGTTTTQPGGGSDAFVTKVGTSGAALVYSTYIGGSAGSDYGYGIAVDGSGSAYIAGYTDSSNFPVVGTTTTYQGSTDAFITKVGTSGAALVYSAYIGGSGTDVGYGIAVDVSGSAYITGYTASSNFPVVGTTTTRPGSYDAFITKLAFTPGVTTGAASGITTSGATLSGTFSGYGRPTTTMFSYGVTSGSYTGTSSTSSLTGSEGDTAVDIAISGLSAGTTYYYRAAANNAMGTSTGSEASFSTSGSGGGGGVTEELTISSTSPSNDAAGVSVTTAVSATFNMYVNGSTVTTDSFTLSSAEGSVSGSVVTNGSTITFTPSLALSYGTKYTATVTTKVQAANWAGTTMESNYTWSFTTESLTAVTPTPAVSPSPTTVATATPAVTPVPSPTSTATSTPVPTLPPRPSPTVTVVPTLSPPPTLPPIPTPAVSIAPTPVGTATPGECTAESMSLSSNNLRLKMQKSKEVTITVTGSDGCLVEGDIVGAKIDKFDRKYVLVLPKRATTDANGQARFKIKAKKTKGNTTVSFTCEEIKETIAVNVVK